jgi:hypothetical protein
MSKRPFDRLPDWLEEHRVYHEESFIEAIPQIVLERLLEGSFDYDSFKRGNYSKLMKSYSALQAFFETEEAKPFADLDVIDGDTEYLSDGTWGSGVTHFAVTVNRGYKAYFSLATLPGCCGIAILTNMSVNVWFRKKGLGTILQELAVELAKAYGYGVLICTYLPESLGSSGLIKKLRWKKALSFYNPRTTNTVTLKTLRLTKEKK